MEDTVVLYPFVGVGHIVPTVELGKLFVRHGFSVVIPVIHTALDSAAFDRIVSANPTITFHDLPSVPLPPNPTALLRFDVVRRITPHLLSFLDSLSRTSRVRVRALVLDFFCTEALDVAVQLGIPSYFFFSTSASNLAAFVRLPTLQKSAASLRDLGDAPLEFPGLQPIPASHLVSTMIETEEVFSEFLSHFERLPKADGIIVNTFESLEARAVKAISDGFCLPDRPMPPIYCIGPLISNENSQSEHECIEWLDSQPLRSVVFLCFGSLGSFSAKQLKEIAVGLEHSGQRFLWMVRSPPSDDPDKRFAPPPEPDLDALLPEGFVEGTKERGLVVKSWAPQAAVLKHEGVGGFVTHCGWNSV